MTEPGLTEPGPPGGSRKSVELRPGFFTAWSAIWMFTWKGRLTWSRLPQTVILLVALPLLVWSTVPSPQNWSPRGWLPLGDANDQVNRITGHLRRSKTPLSTNQASDMRFIYTSEYEKAQRDYQAVTSPEISVDQQRFLIHDSHRRIQERAHAVLDPPQRPEYDKLDEEYISASDASIGEAAWNRTAPFYRWLIDFYFFIILPFSCVWACGGLIRDELQTDTLGFLITRPIKRANLVALKFLAQVTWLEMIVLVEGLLLLGAGALRQVPELRSLAPLFLAVQFLAVPAWSALGLLFGQITKRYLPLALVYGLVVELGIGDIPTNINTLSVMRHLKTLLSHNNELQSLYQWSGSGVFLPVGALVLATVLFVAAAAALFTFREYHANTEMQK